MRSRCLIQSVLVLLGAASQTFAQDRDIKFLSGPDFILSEKAVAAGIDGTLTVSFKVESDGTVKDVDILAGPIWPCDASPGRAIREVREAVRENILASKFSPATKNGKPIDSEAILDFAIGIAYREAVEGKPGNKSRWVVDVGTVGEKALKLPLPLATGYPGIATVRVLIGETGDVISAGTIRGDPRLHAASRMAACDARFPPTIVAGKPIKATALITYEYTRRFVRVR